MFTKANETSSRQHKELHKQPKLRDVVPCASITEKGTFSSCNRPLWAMKLTFELDPDMVKVNQHAKYLGQRSFSSKLLSGHTHTETHRTDFFTWTTKVVCKNRPRLLCIHSSYCHAISIEASPRHAIQQVGHIRPLQEQPRTAMTINIPHAGSARSDDWRALLSRPSAALRRDTGDRRMAVVGDGIA